VHALVQRVTFARVEVAGVVVGEIGPGLLVLIGVGQGDGEAEAEGLAAKLARLRIFSDDSGKMNVSVRDAGNAALVVSQFTRYADSSRGNRPSYSGAAAPEQATRLYDYFSERLRALRLYVANGVFGADMQVSLTNDGPVTVWLEQLPV